MHEFEEQAVKKGEKGTINARDKNVWMCHFRTRDVNSNEKRRFPFHTRVSIYVILPSPSLKIVSLLRQEERRKRNRRGKKKKKKKKKKKTISCNVPNVTFGTFPILAPRRKGERERGEGNRSVKRSR